MALNSETYITIMQQELRTCKRIGYELCCEELFVVKHKSKYSCKSTIYFNLDSETIKENCKFDFYYNRTPTILDGRNEIILANWPHDKYIICNINDNIPVKKPSYPYVLVNRSVMCNCGIEAENHFLLESLAACQDVNSKLVMYFMVNTAFVKYLDQFSNLSESPDYPTIKNNTTFKQTPPISLYVSKFDSNLLITPKNLKDFVQQYNCRKEIFDLKERHATTDLNITNKNFLSDNHIIDVFLLITAIISLLVTNLAICLLCNHKKLRTLGASLALQHVKEVGVVTQKLILNAKC